MVLTKKVVTSSMISFLFVASTTLPASGSSNQYPSKSVYPQHNEATDITDQPNTEQLHKATTALKSSEYETIEISQLNIPQLVDLVVKKNEQIHSQELQWLISQEEVKGAWAIFEPEFSANYQYQDRIQRNTVEERASLEQEDIYEQKNGDFFLSLEGLTKTGATINLSYTMQDMSNTLTDGDHEYRHLAGVSITQPLLKNFGTNTNLAKVKVAESDAIIAFQAYRQEMTRTVANAIITYWDLAYFQELLSFRKDSVRIAQRLLDDNRIRLKTGKIPETEIHEAKTGFLLRKSLENEALQKQISAMNDLRSSFSSIATPNGTAIQATETTTLIETTQDPSKSLKNAFNLRPEYLSSLRKIERENIRISFAENQIWPQLDLKASYGINGLGESHDNAWQELTNTDFDSWSIGLEFSIPLFGGKRAKSELQATKLYKARALRELKAIEIALANSINTAVENVDNTLIQARYAQEIVQLKKHLLDVELAKIKVGKSNSRLVLEKEEEYTAAKEDHLYKLINHKKSIMELKYTDGSLLTYYKHDIDENYSY